MGTSVCICASVMESTSGACCCTWRNIATAHCVRLVCSVHIVDIEMYADQTCSKCGDGRVKEFDVRVTASC